jgi:hypothetical protein
MCAEYRDLLAHRDELAETTRRVRAVLGSAHTFEAVALENRVYAALENRTT